MFVIDNADVLLYDAPDMVEHIAMGQDDVIMVAIDDIPKSQAIIQSIWKLM